MKHSVLLILVSMGCATQSSSTGFGCLAERARPASTGADEGTQSGQPHNHQGTSGQGEGGATLTHAKASAQEPVSGPSEPKPEPAAVREGEVPLHVPEDFEPGRPRHEWGRPRRPEEFGMGHQELAQASGIGGDDWMTFRCLYNNSRVGRHIDEMAGVTDGVSTRTIRINRAGESAGWTTDSADEARALAAINADGVLDRVEGSLPPGEICSPLTRDQLRCDGSTLWVDSLDSVAGEDWLRVKFDDLDAMAFVSATTSDNPMRHHKIRALHDVRIVKPSLFLHSARMRRWSAWRCYVARARDLKEGVDAARQPNGRRSQ